MIIFGEWRKRFSKSWIYLMMLFICSFIIRFMISDFPKQIFVYPDELYYFSIAKGLINGLWLYIYNMPSDFQKILYSLFISPAFLVNNSIEQISFISMINSFIVSSGVLPVYILSRDLCSEMPQNTSRNISLACSFFYCLYPDLCYSMTFMSETLFLPLGLWGLILVNKVINNEKWRYPYFLEICTGLLLYFSYLCKEIAAVFIVALIIYELIVAISDGGSGTKRQIISVIIILITWIGFHLTLKNTLFWGLGSSYNKLGLEVFTRSEVVSYLFYSFFYYLLNASVSMLILPAIFPFIIFKRLNIRQRRFFILLTALLLSSAAVVAYTISIREDFGQTWMASPRAHMRYICYLIPAYIVLFIDIIWSQHIVNISKYLVNFSLDDLIKYKWSAVIVPVIAIIACVAFYVYFNIPTDMSSVDFITLKYIHVLSPTMFCLLKIGVIVFCSLELGLLLFSHYKILISLFAIAFIGTQMISSFIAIRDYRTNYAIRQEIAEEMTCFAKRVYINTHKNTLFLTDKFDDVQRYFDTYLLKKNIYIASMQEVINKQKENDSVVFTAVHTPMTGSPLSNLKQVHFIALRNTPGCSIAPSEVQMLTQNKAYTLYKLNNPTVIPQIYTSYERVSGLTDVMCKNENVKIDILKDSIKIEKDGVLFGPYLTLKKGTYKLKFNCTYDKKVAYNIEIYSNYGKNIIYKSNIKNGLNMLDFIVSQDTDNVEVCVRNNFDKPVYINNLCLKKN